MLAEALVDVAAGRTKRLIVEMPPRHGKSEMVSVWFPVWFLNLRPEARVILASYESEFASSWGRRVRNLINEHARSLNVEVAADSSAANRWHTTAGGGMVTAGVGGAITGRGADILIIDDPVKNSLDANSQVTRQHTWEWWTTTARTRLQPDGAVIIVMTRWHQDDLVGRLLTQQKDEGGGEPWRIVRFPAIAEEEDELGRKPGEALWPEKWDKAALAFTEIDVGPYAWDALYQQRPTAPGGSIFQREWWESTRYRPEDESREIIARFISWDTAVKDGDTNAYTVATVGELWPDYRLGLRHVYRDRLQFPRLPEAIEQLAWEYNRDGKLHSIVIEDKASGTSAIQTLRANAPEWLADLIQPYTPHGDKEYRAKLAAAWCANGMVWLPRPSDLTPWLFDFERELFEFPRSAYADQVDAFSQLILWTENYLEAGLRAREGAVA